jgi:hypothetical protein
MDVSEADYNFGTRSATGLTEVANIKINLNLLLRQYHHFTQKKVSRSNGKEIKIE